jgi:hypothetical protein
MPSCETFTHLKHISVYKIRYCNMCDAETSGMYLFAPRAVPTVGKYLRHNFCLYDRASLARVVYICLGFDKLNSWWRALIQIRMQRHRWLVLGTMQYIPQMNMQFAAELHCSCGWWMFSFWLYLKHHGCIVETWNLHGHSTHRLKP